MLEGRSRDMIINLTILLVAFVFLEKACTAIRENNINENSFPVSHWANDPDPCVRASVKAIMASGKPFPNYRVVEQKAEVVGEIKREVKFVDVWVGDLKFEIPAKYVMPSGFYPDSDPRKYYGLAGSIPNFYPAGEHGQVIDGMAPMVDIKFYCSKGSYSQARWGWGVKSVDEGIASVRDGYQKELNDVPRYPGKVTVSERSDIKMIEVLLETQSETKGQKFWEATYFPIGAQLESLDGSISSIRCKIRHDPIEKRYRNQAWRCSSLLRVNNSVSAEIEVYVSQIEYMPTTFNQVKNLLKDSVVR